MTTNLYTQWDETWTTTSINVTSITSSGGAATTAAISNDQKSGTEVSVVIVMGTGDVGVSVFVLRETGDGSFEDQATDRPWGLMLPYGEDFTVRRSFTVMADRASKFKIRLVNNDSSAVTATVYYKQATIEAA